MQGAPPFEHLSDRSEFRHPAHRDGVELYRAHIVRHAFEPHAHDGFGLGAIESGVERFRYRGAEHLAPPGALVSMNPGELHTGRAETDGGWRYRMLYVDRDVVETVLGERALWFDGVVRHDPARAARVGDLVDALWRAREPLAFDDLLFRFLDEFRPHARRAPQPAERPGRYLAVVEHLHANLARRVTLDELAAVAGLSPFHFLRSFRQQYDATPQQFLMALRLDAAKRRLAAGEAPAVVAAETGLADQAHLTRAFVRRYGVTPARYQRELRA
jgi:AraC-like DNA-binding protein